MNELSQTMRTIPDQIDFVIARNDLLDAFSELECTISRILQSSGHEPKSEPLGNRLKLLRSAEKTSLICKSNFAERDRIADDIAALLPLRADLVHSVMRVAQLNDAMVALFVNSQVAHLDMPLTRILTLAKLRQVVREARKLAGRTKDLAKKSNPPSSPPPPSPDAATAP